jgi:hypothetical protein
VKGGKGSAEKLEKIVPDPPKATLDIQISRAVGDGQYFRLIREAGEAIQLRRRELRDAYDRLEAELVRRSFAGTSSRSETIPASKAGKAMESRLLAAARERGWNPEELMARGKVRVEPARLTINVPLGNGVLSFGVRELFETP